MKRKKSGKQQKVEEAPTPLDKDQKILWARAAGRCSNCRVELTIDPLCDEAKTVGEMCHIIGEKHSSPRGLSVLPIPERSKYTNLILLCRHHHGIIDRDEKRYPTEVLHKMKDDHEQWVTETLGSKTTDPDDAVYSDLIDSITMSIQLDHWSWLVDNAVRDFVPMTLVDCHQWLNRKLLATVWPAKYPKLKIAIIACLRAFDEYITHYISNVEPRCNDKFLGPDRSYRRHWNPKCDHYQQMEERWSQINYALLCKLTATLNNFADAVRKYSNPLYFRVHGRFLVHDSLGYRHGGRDTLLDPDLAGANRLLKRLGFKKVGQQGSEGRGDLRTVHKYARC